MRTRRIIGSTVTLLIALNALPADAAAQTASNTISATPSADQLQERATALHDQIGRYSEAARLYKESAALRAETDPRAVESLAMAAHLYHYANRLFDARKTMEQAARRALARGDVVRASHANLEAALFAHKQGNQAQAGRLGRTALKLADSPLLTDEQRAAIVNRVRSNPAIALLVD
ncbi:MAG TPA: hypothetical protein VFO52_12200 [Longimicrobiales bacterium]|nr:hypothetical protein [Longimicrobiales bacterium]